MLQGSDIIIFCTLHHEGLQRYSLLTVALLCPKGIPWKLAASCRFHLCTVSSNRHTVKAYWRWNKIIFALDLHLLPRSKKEWSYTSTPLHAFIAWCLVKAQG